MSHFLPELQCPWAGSHLADRRELTVNNRRRLHETLLFNS